MEIQFPYKVVNNFQGYIFFSEMHHQTKSCFEEQIVLNFANTKVIESNLFAILGSIIADLERRKNKIRLLNMQEPIQNLFNSKKLINGSARKYLWKCFVKCQQFASVDEEALADYLEVNWVWLRYGNEAISSLQDTMADNNNLSDTLPLPLYLT